MVGILAYGSLIDDPGSEIESLITRRVSGVRTPFSVEFSRSSSSRDGAPTLIPVSRGGSEVMATILVLREDISESEVADMLWRRETRRQGSYNRPKNPRKNTVLIEKSGNVGGIEVVLYTRIGSNIDKLDPQKLAELAITSAKGKAGRKRKDGITYLINAKRNNIATPLMPEYERQILRITGKDSLEDAWQMLVNQRNA